MKPPAVSIIVVSYNTRTLTLACLHSVVTQTEPETYELIVIDNASQDGSADAVSDAFPSMKLIRSSRNLGFACANNSAAEHATGKYLLLLNPDTVVLDRAIDHLLAFAESRPASKIWGGRTLFPDGSLNPTSCWGRQSCWSLTTQAFGLNLLFRNSATWNPESIGGWRRDTVRPVDIVSGCFFMISREFWQQLGGFDDSFFMYGEEADLCMRARARGAEPCITPTATIVHFGGASERIRSDKIAKVLAARTRLMRRHWHTPAVFYGLAMTCLRVLTRWLGYSLVSQLDNKNAREQAEAWQIVWTKRNLWLTGTYRADDTGHGAD